MDIHNIERKKIRSNNVEFVFFNKELESDYNKKYVDLINSTPIDEGSLYFDKWVLTDANGEDYQLLQSNIIEDDIPRLKEGKKPMIRSRFIKYLKNNDLDVSIANTQSETDNQIKYINEQIMNGNMSINLKSVPVKSILWDISKILTKDYTSIIIVDGKVVGKVECEIVAGEELDTLYKDQNIISKNMTLYIANVDVKNTHQGMGLCKPLLSYTIKNLKKLGYDMMFIFNASSTKDGIPACMCYYKAGIENNYNMRYHSKKAANKFQKMNLDDCFISKKRKRNTYFYVSDKIASSGFQKFKKTQKVLKFIKMLQKKKSKKK